MQEFFFAGVEADNEIIFVSEVDKGIYKLKLSDNYLRKIGELESNIEYCLYRDVALFRNKAWFVPEQADKILEVDLSKNVYYEYGIPYKKKNVSVDRQFHYICGCNYKDEYFILIPRTIDAVSIVEIKTSKIYTMYDVIDPNVEKTICAIIVDDLLYIFLEAKTECIEINLLNRTMKRKSIDFKVNSSVVYQNKVWLYHEAQSTVTVYDKSIHNIEKVLNIPDEGHYFGMAAIDDKIVLLPSLAKNFILIDAETYVIQRDNLNGCSNVFTDTFNKVTIIPSSSSRLLFSMGFAGSIVEYKNGFKLVSEKFQVNENDDLRLFLDIVVENERWKIKKMNEK